MNNRLFKVLFLFLILKFDFASSQTCVQFGVNLAGAEFGEAKPGTFGIDYTYPTAQELDYYKQKGLTLIRLPFSWERIQRTPGGPLDATELGRIKTFVSAAESRNILVILDVHNYCRYKINGTLHQIGSGQITVAHFKDLWVRLATEFKSYSNIWGYGLMNEPHDLQGTSWFTMAQAAIDGIRTIDQATPILVGGDSWSSSERWWDASDNLHALSDPQNALIFEAHVYFDNDASGRYDQSYDAEGATPTIGVERVEPFVSWLKEYNLKGFIGEYGVPANDSRWLTTLDNFLKYIRSNGLSGTYWAGGPWWSDYPLSIEPNGSVDKPQMSIVKNYAEKLCLQNIIKNGDFEQGTNSWNIFKFGSAECTIGVEGTDVHGGTAALNAQITTRGENDWDIQVNASELKLEKDTEYTLTLAAKSPTASSLKLIFQNSTYIEKVITTTSTWTEYSWTFTAQESTLQLKLQFPETGTLLLDDFSLLAYGKDLPHNGKCVDPGTGPSVTFTSLKALAPFPIGAAIETTQRQWTSDRYFFENTIRPDLAKQHFNILTAENSMKQGALQGTEGNFTFDDGDEIVEFANANNMKVHGHVLVWHAALPAWMENYSGNYEQMMLTHIEKVLTHYKGKMVSWDVVNEAFTDGIGSGHRSESVWYKNIGSSYIEKAFAKASAVDPDAELYYNDYNLVWGGDKLDRVIEMVNDLKSKNIRIDGVGMQSHITGIDPCVFRESMEKLVATGIKIRISELDIQVKDVANDGTLTAEVAEIQAKRYRDFVAIYKEVVPPAQQGGLIFWGMADRDSWLKDGDWPLLWDAGYNPKPALQAVADGLSGAVGDYSGYEPKKTVQTISFEPPAEVSASQGTITFTAKASSGLSVTYTSSDPNVMSIQGNVGTIHSVGTVEVTANQAGSSDFQPAPAVKRTILVTKNNQTITFNLADKMEVTKGTFELVATTSSGLPTTFTSSNSSIVSVSGSTATIKSTGTVTLTAMQAGNDTYKEAPAVERTIQIVKATQTISFEPQAEVNLSVGNFELFATSSAGLAITFASSNSGIVSISGSTAIIHAEGTVQITATQSGNELYESANEVREITIIMDVLGSHERQEHWNMYPNPARQNLLINFNGLKPISSLTFYSPDGKAISPNILSRDDSEVNIDVSFLPNGVYILQTPEGNSARFIIDR